MIAHGWTLLFHQAIVGQLKNLADACQRARKADPKNFRSNANVKLLAAVAKLILEVIPTTRGERNIGRAIPSERNIEIGSGRSS